MLFSRISWARIFPFGTADSPVSKEGLAHYSDGMLISAALDRELEFEMVSVTSNRFSPQNGR